MKKMSKEVKIGITGVIAIAALFIGLNFLKGINLFKASNSYFIEFSDIKGLAKSSPVYANGYSIGIVHNILYDYKHSGRVVVEVSVDDNMRLPQGTSAKLVSEMLGGCNMHLILGPMENPALVPGDTIQGDDNKGLMDKAADMVPQMQQIIGKVDTLLTTLNLLAANPNLPAILADAKSITENLNKSTAQLNTLMANDVPQLTNKLNHIGDNVETLTAKLNELNIEGTMNKVDTTLNYVQLMTRKMNSKDNTMGLLLNDSSLYNNLSNTASSANKLVIDLKENPKRYVHFSLFGRKEK